MDTTNCETPSTPIDCTKTSVSPGDVNGNEVKVPEMVWIVADASIIPSAIIE